MMTHNQFQREIVNRGIDRQTAYLLTTVFEQQLEVSGQLDEAMKLLAGLVESVSNFVALNEAMEEKLQSVMRRGVPDGVEVHSVVRDPSEDN